MASVRTAAFWTAAVFVVLTGWHRLEYCKDMGHKTCSSGATRSLLETQPRPQTVFSHRPVLVVLSHEAIPLHSLILDADVVTLRL